MTAPSSTLQTLPVEVLLDHVLPTLPTQGLLNLSSTSRQFADLGDDDTLWKRKLLEEFNFSGEGTARTSGWKFIYRGLSRPQTYVWG
jgi:SCF-associated factor 1